MRFLSTATLTPNFPTSELQGDYPSRAVYDLMLSLNQNPPTDSESLGPNFYIVANTTM